MSKRILLVDDEVDFTEMLELGLRQLGGYEVQVVNDPREAIAVARQFSPDLILLDMMMPHMDGSELAATFAADEMLREVPCIFLTALVSRREVHTGSFVRGRRTFLPKPIQWDDLLEVIRQKIRGAS